MVLCLQTSVSSVYQNGMMRYSSSVPSDSDTHDDFKPTQKVPPGGSTDSLKDLVENVTLELLLFYILSSASGWSCLMMMMFCFGLLIGCEGESCNALHERSP